jgi:hypothetical protein
VDRTADRALVGIAQRQARRRRFNERLAALGGREPAATLVAFRCECGLIACSSAIKLTAGEYAAVRADPRWFAVVASHVIPEVEHVVATTREWVTIEKPVESGRPVAAPMTPAGAS